jgi:hypothetical protein
LGGLAFTGSIDTWLSGYSADYSIVSDGDFFQGNDKDLISQVTPLFN